MATINREIKHSLGLDGAKAVVGGLVKKIEDNYGSLISDIKWNDDKTAADVKGKGFSGNFALTADTVKINIELGFLTSPFKGKIEEEIDKQVADLK
jgi:putative polyhydroxyalkanoate system protein